MRHLGFWLLAKGDGGIDGVLVKIAGFFDEETTSLLLKQRRIDIQVTGAVFKAAASNPRSGEGIMKLLLGQTGVGVTDGAVVNIARHFDGEMMRLLLEHRGNHVRITGEVVEAAARNLQDGKLVMILLMESRGDSARFRSYLAKR